MSTSPRGEFVANVDPSFAPIVRALDRAVTAAGAGFDAREAAAQHAGFSTTEA